MFLGIMLRDMYIFKFDQNASENALYLPLCTQADEEASRPGNLKVMRFEVAGALTHTLQTTYFERAGETLPPGSVRLCLRFYDDPPSDLAGFMRVFGDLEMSYTDTTARVVTSLDLKEVVLLSGEWPLATDEVPVIGTWTPQSGFKFNAVPSGVYDRPETQVLAAQSDDSDGDRDGEGDSEEDGATEENSEDPNDLDNASQGREMDQ
jgi:hypothetical protein